VVVAGLTLLASLPTSRVSIGGGEVEARG
jgi:hypothetical protein